jgi:multiple sugar transport system substrate-binding protein
MEVHARAGSSPYLNRRSVLRAGAAGAFGVALGPLLAACTGTSTSGGGSSDAKTATVGSNYSDATPKGAFAAVIAAWQQKSGNTAKVNTVAHNDFQNNINSYLQGNPDNVFTWFSGYRMKFYAAKGLTAPLDEVWQQIGSNFPDSIVQASTAADGKKYLVPWVTYPWAVFYRRSVFSEKGYQVPTKWDDFKALAARMQQDGLVPIAFADSDGWPAMGTFDYLNMRLNGYQFHVDLMAHKESWDSPKVKAIFDNWKSILPYHQSGALGRKWEDAADAIGTKKAGMYVIGSDQIGAELTGEALADLDFFAFPEMDPANGQGAVEAPIDGFMMAKNAAGNPAATSLLEFLGTGAAQMTYLGSNHADVATAKDADTSSYIPLQKKATQFIADAKDISQFLDRDSLPTFASNVMIPALQSFIRTGTFDTSGVESQAKQLFTQ